MPRQSIHLLPSSEYVCHPTLVNISPICKLLGKSCQIKDLLHCNCSLAERMWPGSTALLGSSALMSV